MSLPFYLAIRGKFVINNYEPDGDSVRFIATNPNQYQSLHRAHTIRLSRDGSVQTRFEAIDAPELHYGGSAQPDGQQARDQLLSLLGFTNVQFNGTKAVGADQTDINGVILTNAADVHGRPIAYILREQDLPPADGRIASDGSIRTDSTLLALTMNQQLLEAGLVYLLLYTSTPLEHRRLFRAIASTARSQQLGVWQHDSTPLFTLDNQQSIDPDGQLIYPKLFRRCTDYMKAVNKGFPGNLADWMGSISLSPTRHEDDQVLVAGNDGPIHFSDLLNQRNDKIAFGADLLDLVFVEQP